MIRLLLYGKKEMEIVPFNILQNLYSFTFRIFGMFTRVQNIIIKDSPIYMYKYKIRKTIIQRERKRYSF